MVSKSSTRETKEYNFKKRTISFLFKIREDLDPTSFSGEEILSEGLEGVLFSGVIDERYRPNPPKSKARGKKVKEALQILCDEKMIEKIHGENDAYRVTDLGMTINEEFVPEWSLENRIK